MMDELVFIDDADDPRMQDAMREIESIIRARYPAATFAVGYGDDPEGLYLRVTVDVEDTEEVEDLYIDRLIDLQLEHHLALHVILLRTPERIEAMQRDRQRVAADPALAGST